MPPLSANYLKTIENLAKRIDKMPPRKQLLLIESTFFSSRAALALIVFLNQTYLNQLLKLPTLFPFPTNLLGLPPITLGIMLDILSIRTFLNAGGTPFFVKPPQRLVVAGPYGYLRNPLYLSLSLTLLGFTILLDSPWLLIATIILILIINFLVIPREETNLGKKFGQEYQDYKRKVPRWIPRIKP